MSRIELFTLYMPVTQNSITSGSRIFFGTRSMLANSGTNGQVEQQQDEVADVHAGDDRPEELRVLGDQQRPRRDAVDQQRAEQDRGDRPERDAEDEERASWTTLMIGSKSR